MLLDGRPLQGPSATRGIGTYLRGLLDGLTELGRAGQISVLLSSGAEAPSVLQERHIPVAGRLPVLKRSLQPIADPLLVMRCLRVVRPRLYHAVEWAQPLWAGDVPVVITLHDLIPFRFDHHDYKWMRRERLLALHLLRRADAVIAVSRSTAEDAITIARVDPQRVHVVHHGVSSWLRPAEPSAVAAVRRRYGLGDGDFVLAVGSFDHRKRVDLLMDVMRRLVRSSCQRLVIAGDQGVYQARVEASAAHAGVAQRVVLAGFVAPDDLRALYSGATCLVFTSAYEGFGLPVLEAMACGCPVVAYRNSSIPEVAGEAGLLVDDGDASAMAEAVATLIGDATARERRVASGRSWAAGFTWPRCAEATLDVYRQIQT